eukprot:gene26076-34684_t
MGNSKTKEKQKEMPGAEEKGPSAVTKNGRQLKVLCLHGWRTSGKIFSMQSAAMRFHTGLECEFIDAPHSAEGPPDGGIAIFYPAEFNSYYQWDKKPATERKDDSNEQAEDESVGMQQSVEFVLQYLLQHGPFDGLMGFSQGAAMVTRVAMIVAEQHCAVLPSLRFLILIGGVQPLETRFTFLKDPDLQRKISMPSLHLMGSADPFLSRSRLLRADFYEEASSTVLEHGEGHNIPSIRTNLYPAISQWLEKNVS